MKYYVYFDGYGHARAIISEVELSKKYNGDPQLFLKAMAGIGPESKIKEATGHIGTLSFDSEKELKEYLESCGDVIKGFFECEFDSRPYNF
ncbi:MAG: hypothetical protein JRH08_00485 [Deltaproteobacteria bacterium]|nr:hypothetical protein [Deltaproteobacteria bacterium]MBW1929450.1 hypothetical protein [Deltaproteobacteria bacterium]MBW2023891.1 hypothetical protein [Deltaproteobacteria bacterium]MBW2124180.1 hypothetical protein [Deltaproteobacteria bacterium]RLB19425.1 MAG: hypothetical protein DRG63_01000 [Deltaproteobacteria bacterium]